MLKLYLILVLGLFATVYAQDGPPETVPELDVELYLGRWYQMYANILVNVTFERNSYCVTADYGPINETYISVYNAGRKNSPTGRLSDIYGFAYIVDPAEPGKLLVDLERGAPEPGEYWIIQLGPETFGDEGLYQYSIISNANRRSLFVLARDAAIFRVEYQEEVLAYLADNGFDQPINEPLETYQADDCDYAPVP